MRRQRGGVFVFTLITLTALVAILAGITATRRIEMRAVGNRMDTARAESVAWTGVNRCLSLIRDQLQSGQVPWLETDTWATFGEIGSQRFIYSTGSVRLQIVDSSAFLNINAAEQAQLERLPLTLEQVEALLDWREDGFIARPSGAKDEYYNQLPNPYNARLRPLESVDELLLIRGFTPDTLNAAPTNLQTTAPPLLNEDGTEAVLSQLITVVSRSANIAADGQTKLNINTTTAQALVARGIPLQLATQIIQIRNTQGTFQRLGDVLLIPGINTQNAGVIVDNLTVSGASELDGLINVNTASEAVLSTLPGISQDIAAAIVQRQQTGIMSLGSLFEIPGLDVQTMAQVVDRLTVNSRSFIVRAIGQHGPVRIAIEATVRIINDEPRVISHRTLPVWRAILQWGWPEEPSADVDFGGTA